MLRQKKLFRWERVIKATDMCSDRGAGEASHIWERMRSPTCVETEEIARMQMGVETGKRSHSWERTRSPTGVETEEVAQVGESKATEKCRDRGGHTFGRR